jgi:glycosyltransferase involved in cell wall biosynthesis
MKPLVSIVLPIYNAAPYLLECLNSIKSQTYRPIELIAIDDSSTDASWQILNSFAKNNKWVKTYRNKSNQGVSFTFNFGVFKASSNYVARMDADDVMFPDRIKLQIDYLLDHPRTVILGGQCLLINEQGSIIGKKTFPQKDNEIKDMLFRTVPMQQPTIMINRSLFPEGFMFSDSQFSPAEDYGLFFNAISFGDFANLPQNTLKYREHKTNISLTNPKLTFWRIWRARRHGLIHCHYRPSIKSVTIVFLQTLAVLILPSKIIYPLHTKLRGMK